MTETLERSMAKALAGDPESIAIEYQGTKIRWGVVAGVANGINALLDEARIGDNVPVGFIPESRPEFAAALIGLIAGKRSISMIYSFQAPAVIALDITKLDAQAYVAPVALWTPEVIAALPAGAIAIGVDLIDSAMPARLMGGELTADRSHLRGATEGPVIELLTSGTTGSPKRQPTPFRTIYAAVIEGNMVDVDEPGKAVAPGILQFPLSNISGIYTLLPYAAARRPVRLIPRFNIKDWLEFVREHKPPSVVLPPAGVQMLLESDAPDDALAGVRFISMGMTGLDPNLWKAFEKRFGVPILYSYGATEFAGAATAMNPDLHARYGAAKFGTVGKPTGRNEIRIIDAANHDRILGANEEGLIEVRVPYVGPDWIRTNDLGVIDEDGFLFVRGRADGAIKRGGFKILPAPIETVLVQHPAIAAACVIGVADERLGEVPVAVVELRPGAESPSEVEMQDHVRSHLPSTNVPVEIRILDALPRTQSFKIELRAVRALFAKSEKESVA